MIKKAANFCSSRHYCVYGGGVRGFGGRVEVAHQNVEVVKVIVMCGEGLLYS